MNGGAMQSYRRNDIDPAEEARHREVMAGLGVHDADWALFKVLKTSDLDAGQNRLLLTKGMVHGGPIPKLFPELEELRGDGLNAQRSVSAILLDAEGRENVVSLGYLNSTTAYRIRGPDWKRFREESGICKGDRLDLYTFRRGNGDGDGEQCLFAFRSKGGGGSDWCTNRRKRARQPAAAAAVLDHKKRAKKGRSKREAGRMAYVMHDTSCTGGFHGDYGCFKAAGRTREEDEAPPRSWKDYATEKEKQAVKGLLMLKYAILAGHYR